VIFPTILPALLTGFALALRAPRRIRLGGLHRRQHADGVGNHPLFIVTKLEQYDYAGATAIAMVMLLVSFILLLTINLLQA
jgi:sulfate transport system permease protein